MGFLQSSPSGTGPGSVINAPGSLDASSAAVFDEQEANRDPFAFGADLTVSPFTTHDQQVLDDLLSREESLDADELKLLELHQQAASGEYTNEWLKLKDEMLVVALGQHDGERDAVLTELFGGTIKRGRTLSQDMSDNAPAIAAGIGAGFGALALPALLPAAAPEVGAAGATTVTTTPTTVLPGAAAATTTATPALAPAAGIPAAGLPAAAPSALPAAGGVTPFSAAAGTVGPTAPVGPLAAQPVSAGTIDALATQGAMGISPFTPALNAPTAAQAGMSGFQKANLAFQGVSAGAGMIQNSRNQRAARRQQEEQQRNQATANLISALLGQSPRATVAPTPGVTDFATPISALAQIAQQGGQFNQDNRSLRLTEALAQQKATNEDRRIAISQRELERRLAGDDNGGDNDFDPILGPGTSYVGSNR